MTEKISLFIEENIDLIDNNNFEELYNITLKKLLIEEIPQLTKVLLDADINPLLHMNRIPTYFLAGQAIPEITIPANIIKIDGGAFRESEIMEIHFAPGSQLKLINAAAFRDCQGLTSIELPDTVTTIGTQAFKGCSRLEKLILPESLTSIPAALCMQCYELKQVNIPMNCEQIGTKAFEGCELVKFYVPRGKKNLRIDNNTAEWFKDHCVFV